MMNTFPSKISGLLLFLVIISQPLNAADESQTLSSMSIEEMHQAAENVINYAADSTYKLLEEALARIHCLEEGEEKAAHMAENHLRRADYYWAVSLPQAKYHVDKAFKYFQKHPHDKKLAEVYYVLGAIDVKEGNKDTHLHYLDTSITYALKSESAQLIASIYTMQGFYLQTYNRWQESYEKAQLAIEYAEKATDSLPLSTSYFILAQIKEHFNQLDEAEELFEKSIAYGEGHYDMAGVYRGYGSVLLKNNKIDKGLAAYRHSMELYAEEENYPYVMLIRVHMGEALLDHGRLEEATANFEQSKKLVSLLEDNIHIHFLYYAKMHAHLGEVDQAKSYIKQFKEAENFKALKGNDIDKIKNLAEVYEVLNERGQALHYYKKWGTLKDSIQSLTAQSQLNDMEKLYMTEKSRNEEIMKKNEALVAQKKTQFAMGGGIVAILLLAGIAVYFVRLRGHKEREELRLQIKSNQLKDMLSAQEDERKRLARELHDGIGQSLAALKMQLQMADDSQTSNRIIKKVNEICSEVRSLSHQMMPLILQENGLEEALEWLANQSLIRNSLQVDLVVQGRPERLNSEIETHLYRVAQELLTNVVKHSQATNVEIQLLRPEGKVILVVEDNGIGFKPDEHYQGIGLANIYSRVESISGSIDIQPKEGQGTYVRIVLPVSVEERLTA